jgi:flagellar biosynthesis/type III secretory pathway protein FliH
VVVEELKMKSFSNYHPGVINVSTASKWAPEEFGQTNPEYVMNEIEELTSIFPPKSSSVVVNGAASCEKYSVWAPMDIFNTQEHSSTVSRNEWWPSSIETQQDVKRDQDVNTLFQVKKEAEKIIEEAKAQAEVILKNAKVDAEKIGKQAFSDEVARAQWEMQTSLQATKEIVNQVAGWQIEVMEQSEGIVLDLVKDIAKALFSEGIALDDITLQQTFNKAISNARPLGDLRIFINPEDAQVLDPSWREFQSSVSGQKVQIVPSDAIRRGGCYIEGQLGSVDARTETQLTEILDSMTSSFEDTKETE